MATLNDLIIALGTVLIRYHDEQVDNWKLPVPKKISALNPVDKLIFSSINAKEILTKKNYKEELEHLNNAWLIHYPDRSDFGHYLVRLIINLKTIQAASINPGTTNPEADIKFITCILSDFKKLLNTSKDSTCNVQVRNAHNENETIPVKGFLLSGIYKILSRSDLCASGRLIKEEIFDKFNILLSEKDDQSIEFKELATEWYTPIELLLKQNYALLEELNDVKKKEEYLTNDLNLKMAEYFLTIGELQKGLKLKEAEISQLHTSLETEQQEIERLRLLLKNTQGQTQTVNPPAPAAHICQHQYPNRFGVWPHGLFAPVTHQHHREKSKEITESANSP